MYSGRRESRRPSAREGGTGLQRKLGGASSRGSSGFICSRCCSLTRISRTNQVSHRRLLRAARLDRADRRRAALRVSSILDLGSRGTRQGRRKGRREERESKDLVIRSLYAPEKHLMRVEGEGGEERRQRQHQAADDRRDPRIAATTRADDQRRRAAGDRGAQRPRPH